MKGYDAVDDDEPRPAPQVCPSGNGMILQGRRVNLNTTKNFFTYNITAERDHILGEALAIPTMVTLKIRLDKHLNIRVGSDFNPSS